MLDLFQLSFSLPTSPLIFICSRELATIDSILTQSVHNQPFAISIHRIISRQPVPMASEGHRTKPQILLGCEILGTPSGKSKVMVTSSGAIPPCPVITTSTSMGLSRIMRFSFPKSVSWW